VGNSICHHLGNSVYHFHLFCDPMCRNDRIARGVDRDDEGAGLDIPVFSSPRYRAILVDYEALAPIQDIEIF